MKFARVILVVVSAIGISIQAFAAPEQKLPQSPVAVTEPATNEEVIEFGGDDVRAALQKLAKMAHVSLILADDVKGRVSVRTTGRSPLEVIGIIVDAKGFIMDERPDGVFRITAKGVPIPKELQPYFSLIEFRSRLDVVHKLAVAKRRFYDALVEQGFSKEEALQIILHEQYDTRALK